MTERWSVLKILQWTTRFFTDKGISSPRLDAELLLADTLNLDRVGLYMNYDRPLDLEELAHYRQKVQRRAQHEPVQYILGKTEFWSLTLLVDRRVLIPRADTEILVEEALKQLQGRSAVLDVGTGSGAIALALACERPQAVVTAIDLSPESLKMARANAARNHLDGRIDFQHGDLAELPAGPFDLIVSNPPYVPTRDWQQLMPEVRDYEPRLALDGGDDGLHAFRLLGSQADRVLHPGGWLMVEVGIDQADLVAAIFGENGLVDICKRDDYAGIPRVVCARRNA